MQMEHELSEILKKINLSITKVPSYYTKLAESSLAIYLAKRKEFHERKIGRYWASDLGNCLYKNYLLYKEGDNEKTINGIILAGIILHEALEEGFREMGYEVEKEVVKKYDGFEIVGCADVVGDNFIIDIKTSKYDNISNGDVKKSYLMQLAFYVFAFEKDVGVILITRRNDLKLVAYEYTKEELRKYYEEAINRARLLHECLVKGIEPEPEPNSLCFFCELKDRCPAYNKNKKSNGNQANQLLFQD